MENTINQIQDAIKMLNGLLSVVDKKSKVSFKYEKISYPFSNSPSSFVFIITIDDYLLKKMIRHRLNE